MSYDLPDDWYIEHTGESRILDQKKVAAELAHLRLLNEQYLREIARRNREERRNRDPVGGRR